MSAAQIDEALKSIYRALADGEIAEEAAEAAEVALHGRRTVGGRITAPPTSRPATGRRGGREKMFGVGRPRALDRNAKVRILHLARALSHRTEPGKHYGQVTAKALAVLEALLWGFHNARSGICFPSLATIGERAKCAVSTAQKAIAALEAAGLLTWVNRIKRVREWAPGLPGVGATRVRVVRTSNSYQFSDPASANPSNADFRQGTSNQGFNSSFCERRGGCKEARRGAHWIGKRDKSGQTGSYGLEI
ncbi:helix-turn-helix domain-containing protein [Roseiarcus sp.]|uniref:helix-turn-helix domain-containing protein n=1 Tax=Roseiarcus sp. TaxID=1969460 RepID=UPI003F9B70A3